MFETIVGPSFVITAFSFPSIRIAVGISSSSPKNA